MKTIIGTILLLSLIVVAALGFMANRSKTVPVGVGQGGVAGCPDRPNCVSSLSEMDQTRVEPLAVKGDIDAAWLGLQREIQELGGTVERTKTDYLWATFRSDLFGFVDDAEFVLDRGKGVIQIKAGARVGRSDFGVNRKRIEIIRARLAR